MMQNGEYIKLTIYENSLNGERHGKLDYFENNQKHSKKVFDNELERVIEEFKRQTKMSEYQLKSNNRIVELDLHQVKSLERKNKILDAIAVTPKKSNMEEDYYYPRQSNRKNIVHNLQVRNQNVHKVIRNGALVLAVAASIFVAGRAYSALTETPQVDLTSLHKVDNVNVNERNVINGTSRAESIISNLVRGKYESISKDDISFLENYYTVLGHANSDNNDNFFISNAYTYFANGLNKNEKNVFGRVQSLASDMHKRSGEGDRFVYNKEAMLKYCIYAMTLVSGGEDTLPYENQNKKYDVASKTDAYIFYQMKPEYKLPILINLKATLEDNNINLSALGYNIYKIESYQFNKEAFIEKLDDAILVAKMQLESMCGVKGRGK